MPHLESVAIRHIGGRGEGPPRIEAGLLVLKR
jgi:hypothetical protein